MDSFEITKKIPRIKPLSNSEKAIFFSDFAAEMGTLDKSFSSRCYYSLIRMIIKKLKKESMIRMPEFGTLMIREKKRTIKRCVRTGKTIEIGKTSYVKFRPHVRMKEYFKNYF